MAHTRATQQTHPAGEPAPVSLRVGLIGHGIGLSRTPKMHVEEGKANGLGYEYALIDTASRTETIDALLTEVARDGYRGVNVTHPFKQAVLPFLDQLSDAAQAVGAVNTVVFDHGRRIGHNTDYWGFAEAFRRRFGDVRRARVLLLGAGGAGGAVAHALLDCGVDELWIYDPNQAASTALADQIAAQKGAGRVRVADDPLVALAMADGVVNATPVGMASHPGSPVPVAALKPAHWVADIIYFPLETELLRAARNLGCQLMDGSGMAVFQAVRAFELFTGIAPDPKRMRATFDAFVPPSAGVSGTDTQ